MWTIFCPKHSLLTSNSSQPHYGIFRHPLTTFSDFISFHRCEIGMKFLAVLDIWEGKIQIPWLNKKWTLFCAKAPGLSLHSDHIVSLRAFSRCIYSILFAYLWFNFHEFYLLFWDTNIFHRHGKLDDILLTVSHCDWLGEERMIWVGAIRVFP